jgi:hypothetical protein
MNRTNSERQLGGRRMRKKDRSSSKKGSLGSSQGNMRSGTYQWHEDG